MQVKLETENRLDTTWQQFQTVADVSDPIPVDIFLSLCLLSVLTVMCVDVQTQFLNNLWS